MIRWLGFSLIVLALAGVQISVLPVLPLPGATPDVLALAVLGIAAARGFAVGALAGLTVGLVMDVVGPATGPFGLWALILALVGAAVGRITMHHDTKLVTLGVLVGASAAIVVMRALLGMLLADSSVAASTVPMITAATAVYALVLGPLALDTTRRVADRLLPVAPR